jgi:peptide/nickel transport system substrate-binding protein
MSPRKPGAKLTPRRRNRAAVRTISSDAMPNRFGLKDLLLFVLIGIGLLFTGLSMCQSDRYWRRNEDVRARLQAIEAQLGGLDGTVRDVGAQVNTLKSAVEQGVKVTGPAPAPGAPAPATGAPAASSGDSWARPGVKIERQPPFTFATDPRSLPDVQPGGEITEIWEAQTKTLTPSISTDVYSRRLQELVLESLGAYNSKTLEIQGVLAEAWQVDPQGLWLRARLRQGVRFSDGQPVTAEDIRWSFHDYLMNEQIEAERTRSIYRDSIEKVTVIDPRTVEFTFKNVLFTNVSNALGLFILPKHIYSELSPAQINRSTGMLVGSGPFKMRAFNADNQWAPPADIVIERNEQYWGPRPVVAALRYQAVNEEIGRLNAFAKGDAHIITPSAPQFVSKSADPDWQARANFLQWVNMRSGYSFIAWNCGERNGKLTPFHDRRVRLAMTHALDREKLIRDIYKGIGVVAKGNQPLGSPGSDPDIKPWPFDPARAAELFKEAGWEDRDGNGVLEDKLGSEFTFQFTYAGGSEIGDRIAKFVKDAYQAAGIKVEINSVEWAKYTDLLKTRDFDAITLGWGASAPESDPRQIFHSESIKNQGDNFAQWISPKADELIDAGRREMDPVKRAAVWRQLEAELHQQQPYTFLRTPPWLRLTAKHLGNVNTYPKGLEPAEYFLGKTATPTPGM